MKILVTGATGFIGGAVARKLLQQGHQVVAMSQTEDAFAKLRAAGMTPVVGDFANPASLVAPVTEVDAVVSLASIGQIEGTPESFAKDRDAVAVVSEGAGAAGGPFFVHSRAAFFVRFTQD